MYINVKNHPASISHFTTLVSGILEYSWQRCYTPPDKNVFQMCSLGFRIWWKKYILLLFVTCFLLLFLSYYLPNTSTWIQKIAPNIVLQQLTQRDCFITTTQVKENNTAGGVGASCGSPPHLDPPPFLSKITALMTSTMVWFCLFLQSYTIHYLMFDFLFQHCEIHPCFRIWLYFIYFYLNILFHFMNTPQLI